jgi:PAS domain S-box-containing protein
MPNPATLRERRLRMTKAQLIDEIDTLEQRAAATEATNRNSAPMRAKTNERYLTKQQLAHLARFTSENPNPVLRAMPDGTVLYANDAAIAVNKLLKGRKKSMLADDLVEVFAEASHSAEVRETEFKSGDRVFVFSITPVANETYINIYGRDITKRKQTEQALLESEKRFRDLFESAAHGMNLTALDGRFSAVNNALCEMLGYSEEELLATDFQTITHPDDIDRDLADWRALIAGEIRSYQMEKRYVHKQGHLIDVLLSVSLIRDSNDEPLYAVGHVHDITERKRTEEELARKEAQLRVALDNMPGGIRFVDEDRNYVLFNDRYLELYDFPEGLLKVGEPLRIENLYQAKRGDFGPGDPETLTDEWIAALPRETEPESWERTTVAGKVLHVSTAPTPVGGYVNIVTDITERKRIEEALREHEQLLEAVLDHMPTMVYLPWKGAPRGLSKGHRRKVRHPGCRGCQTAPGPVRRGEELARRGGAHFRRRQVSDLRPWR